MSVYMLWTGETGSDDYINIVDANSPKQAIVLHRRILRERGAAHLDYFPGWIIDTAAELMYVKVRGTRSRYKRLRGMAPHGKKAFYILFNRFAKHLNPRGA